MMYCNSSVFTVVDVFAALPVEPASQTQSSAGIAFNALY